MKAGERKAWEVLAKVARAAVWDQGKGAGGRARMGNRATVVDGITFQSKLESDRYRELELLNRSGEVAYFLRQVPFDVAPKVRYRADFVIVWNRSGPACEIVTVEDTKGFLTSTARVKIAAVEHRYRIKITILTRANVRRF